MNNIERIITETANQYYKNDECYKELSEEEMFRSIGIVCAVAPKLANAIKQYVIKARIKDRETTKSLMEYTGDTDLWYEDNNEKLAELKKGINEK